MPKVTKAIAERIALGPCIKRCGCGTMLLPLPHLVLSGVITQLWPMKELPVKSWHESHELSELLTRVSLTADLKKLKVWFTINNHMLFMVYQPQRRATADNLFLHRLQQVIQMIILWYEYGWLYQSFTLMYVHAPCFSSTMHEVMQWHYGLSQTNA